MYDPFVSFVSGSIVPSCAVFFLTLVKYSVATNMSVSLSLGVALLMCMCMNSEPLQFQHLLQSYLDFVHLNSTKTGTCYLEFN